MTYLRSQRDISGTLREYETIYILRPEATTDQIHDVNTRIRKVIDDAGGKLLRVDNWGKRKLAYEIRKQLKGIYLYWLYLGEATLVTEIERNLRMLDLVIRYYTVKIDETVDPEARPSQMDEESFAATATTVPDEEDAYLGRMEARESAEKPASAAPETEVTAAASGAGKEAQPTAQAPETQAVTQAETQAETQADAQAPEPTQADTAEARVEEVAEAGSEEPVEASPEPVPEPAETAETAETASATAPADDTEKKED